MPRVDKRQRRRLKQEAKRKAALTKRHLANRKRNLESNIERYGRRMVIPPRKSGADKWNFLIMSTEEIHMKKSRFSEHQILQVLKQAEAGTPVAELCREHGISSATFYNWRAKYGGMDASMMARMKELEAENRRLKKMYAEERLKAEIVQEALAKKS